MIVFDSTVGVDDCETPQPHPTSRIVIMVTEDDGGREFSL